MKYIQPCTKCGSELRFPIDRGVLIIRCPNCQNSIKVDPNEPSTYLTGRFDLKIKLNKEKRFKEVVDTFFDLLYIPIDIGKTYFPIFNPKDVTLKQIIPYILILLLFLNVHKCLDQVKKIPKGNYLPPKQQQEENNNQDWQEEDDSKIPYQI
ncbi:MAG: hypothetical protein H7A23_21595 [Leptospiraceae bacterium]|nr:hypothetical protein [Leptospiraceae bacterium]MCP5497158.1 hypothetical protein [Leptospiraceae bacterium]